MMHLKDNDEAFMGRLRGSEGAKGMNSRDNKRALMRYILERVIEFNGTPRRLEENFLTHIIETATEL